MRTFTKLAMAFGLVAGLSSQAFAQGGRGGGFGGPAMFLGNPAVQKELKLSDEQIAKAKTLQTSLSEKRTELMSGFQDLSQEERQAKFPAIQKEMNAAFDKGAAEFLKPEQTKRLKQIVRFNQGAMAFADPEVATQMKITDDQKTKIKDLTDAANAERREIFQSAGDDREGAMKKMTELNKATTEKVMGVLTSEQKASWKEMTGEPFPVQFPPRRPGGNP